MSVSYKKRWKLLVDKGMKKKHGVQRQVSARPQLLRWDETLCNEKMFCCNAEEGKMSIIERYHILK